MQYSVLATDYDGTLATEGAVDSATLTALERYRHRGGRLLLVTGRQLDELLEVFPHGHLFAGIVAENGGVFYQPAQGITRRLAEPLPPVLIDTLKARGVGPISQGQIVVATWEPHGETVEHTVRELALAATVIRNKKAVMVLPQGVNKASGLAVALADLGVEPAQVVGVGDAENDRSLLESSGLGVAVGNAVPELKALADRVMTGDRGAGVQELIAWLLTQA
ncbi:HAD family hydrolase [Leptolyngbya sp. KIOST-1]|uniref:HAD family hydrolase n=1 Tax=Leptolyngbya sp. KIOST-1 TaxID=1229172 RepID=UPI0005686F8E|nr:HAD family hydrolase [Leptolyngbya sp. KIOST-1]